MLSMIRESAIAFVDDEALTRGAAIAFYTVTSIGPVLFIVVAIAGLAFGEDAARGAISSELAGLMGQQSADLLETAIKSAARSSSGFLPAAIGIVTLVITASGVFTEMQQTLNVIWRAELNQRAPRYHASCALAPLASDSSRHWAFSCWCRSSSARCLPHSAMLLTPTYHSGI